MRLGAVILAAGQSKRFGRDNKLLHEVGCEPLLRRVVRAFEEAEVERILVVLGHEAEQVRRALCGTRAVPVVNPDYEQGMGRSLACGIAALDREGLEGVLVSVGDLPRLAAKDVGRVAAAFVEEGGEKTVVPVSGGVRGHPVCLPARLFPDLLTLSGDVGAKHVIERDVLAPVLLEMGDGSCSEDLDTIT